MVAGCALTTRLIRSCRDETRDGKSKNQPFDLPDLTKCEENVHCRQSDKIQEINIASLQTIQNKRENPDLESHSIAKSAVVTRVTLDMPL
eukprot:SAG31_NODE_9495_length_1268_cov_1.118905_2_plen_90_part_00